MSTKRSLVMCWCVCVGLESHFTIKGSRFIIGARHLNHQWSQQMLLVAT